MELKGRLRLHGWEADVLGRGIHYMELKDISVRSLSHLTDMSGIHYMELKAHLNSTYLQLGLLMNPLHGVERSRVGLRSLSTMKTT